MAMMTMMMVFACSNDDDDDDDDDDYPIYCLPQNCLLVGNPEVGNSDTINHQDCLP